MKKTGGDFLTLTEIREMLRETNDAYDGPAGVALVIPPGETVPRLCCEGTYGDPFDSVVDLPGDGLPFPERAYAEALRVSSVIVERE